MPRFAWGVAVGLAVLSSIVQPAGADDCKLQVLPVDLVPNSSSTILMSLKVDDKPATFMLDTGAFWSVIRKSKIGDFSTHHQRIKVQGLGDKSSNEVAILPSLSIGPLKLEHREMFVVADDMSSDDRIWGVIGADILKPFDVEFNLAENKLNFFLPSSCGDRVVYWKNDGFAALPFEFNDSNHITFYMQLDGKRIKTVLDTGAFASVLNLSTASWLFDLRPGEPGVEDSGKSVDINGEKLPLYRHRFEKLEIEGLVFNKPLITISKISGANKDERPGQKFDFLLGRHQLRGLHVFISYHEKMIYMTKAAVKMPEDMSDDDAPPVAAPQMDALDRQIIQPYIDRADAAARGSDIDGALAALNELLAQYPNYPQVYLYRARIYLQRKNSAAAVADLDKAIGLLPTYADAYRLRSSVRRENHDEAGAKADLDAAARFEPTSAITFEMRAEQRRQSHDADGALADAGHAIELDPKLPSAYVTRGVVFLGRKDYDQALADFQQAIVLDPKNAFALEGAARAFHRLGRQDEALSSYAHAIELAPNVARYRNGRCWQLAIMERFQDALGDCNRGVELAPKWSPVVDSRGYVYLKLHRLKEAIADFDTALAINPSEAHSMYGRSLAKQELGDAKGARADLAAAQAMQPDIAQHFPE
jgi:tetratricopeptide (TPR) repeat protein/predicted aspartyl protease